MWNRFVPSEDYNSFQNIVEVPQDDGEDAEGFVKMHEAFVANHQPAAIVHPAEATLDLVTLTMARTSLDRTPFTGYLPLSIPKQGKPNFDGRFLTVFVKTNVLRLSK